MVEMQLILKQNILNVKQKKMQEILPTLMFEKDSYIPVLETYDNNKLLNYP